MDGAATRTELWARYESGRLSADELEARLLLVDRATDDAELVAALDGNVPIRRRRSVRRARPALILVLVLVLLGGVAGVAALAGGRGGDEPGPQPGAVATLVGPLPPPIPAGVAGNVAGDVECAEADEARANQPPDDAPPADLVFGSHILSDPPAILEGYNLVDDFEVGAETDIGWQISAGEPPPVLSWGRELQDKDGNSIQMRGFEYENAEAAAAVGQDGWDIGICQYDAVPFDVPEVPGGGGVMVSVTGSQAYASFTAGNHRIILRANDFDLEVGRERASAALLMEWEALLASQPAE